MNKTKIDWCDYVWNPVWGCLNNCEYCYARKLARRFWKKMYEKEWEHLDKQDLIENNSQLLILEENLKNYRPIFLDSNFNKSFPKKPARIFVNSMSEIYYWKEEWMERVLEKIRKYPQHTFIFLTKFPEVYYDYDFPENCWLGITETGETQDKLDCALNDLPKHYDFFLPWAGMEKAQHANENPADVKAAEKMAKLLLEFFDKLNP